uniref:THAP-type domain-containing protein n=1 Tax=Schizaphis graminum TaxID=13262 RepID=A0A2S2P469_SCHGA
MPKCVFEGCSSGCRKKGIFLNKTIVLHRFPKDDEMRLLWQKQINKNKINFDSGINGFLFTSIYYTFNFQVHKIIFHYYLAVVCSLHFKPYHYNLPKKHSTNKNYARLLKDDAIPLK